MFSSKEVHVIANDIARTYGGSIEEKKDSYGVNLTFNNKRLYIDWPKHDLAEVWVTFQQDGEDLYQDWFECMENEGKTEFIEYIKSIPKRYFDNPVRVKKYGIIFRRHVLEYKNGEKWCELLAS